MRDDHEAERAPKLALDEQASNELASNTIEQRDIIEIS